MNTKLMCECSIKVLKGSKEKQVYVVVEHLSHYRLGVYRELQESKSGLRFSFYGNLEVSNGIQPIPAGSLENSHHVETLRFASLRWQKSVLKLAWKRDADALVLLGDFRILSTWLVALLARARGKKVLFWTMGWSKPEPLVLWKLRKYFYSLADVLLLYSTKGLALAREYGIPESRIVVVGNSIYTRTQLDSLAEKVVSTEKKAISIGAVARITSNKKFELLLLAIQDLRAKGIDVNARIAGEGEELARLEHQAQLLELPVQFVGAIYTPAELSAFYSIIDLTVIPTYAGLTIVQSMSHGVPVITGDDFSDQGPEVEAIIPSTTGFFFKNGSVDALVTQITNYMRLSQEEKMIISTRGKLEIQQHWTVESQANKLLDGLRLAFDQVADCAHSN